MSYIKITHTNVGASRDLDSLFPSCKYSTISEFSI